jgi:hypothetical protein
LPVGVLVRDEWEMWAKLAIFFDGVVVEIGRWLK